MRAYHETYQNVVEDIRENGIKAGVSADTVDIQVVDGSYVTPDESTRTAFGYAHMLINTVLRNRSPDQYPRRTRGVWMFNKHDTEQSRMGRNTLVEIDFERVVESHTAIAIPWDVATETYWDTMDSYEIVNHISVDELHEKCDAYWDSATVVESVSDVPDVLCEMYIDSPVLDPSHIVDIKEISQSF